MSDILKNIWPDWIITEKIGTGAFGTVYSAKKEDRGCVYESAIKVIHIPQDDSELRDLRHSGMDYQSICGFYRDIKEGLWNEISVMETLRTAANIVSIDDYKEVPSEDGIGWTMYIRMEKLTSLNQYQDRHVMTVFDIVKLGIDICSALVCCEKENIIHRDIKPDNIFVNKYGDFKLGDFGIARHMEKTQSVFSQKGTYQYMAPEVYYGKPYNQTVDMYSLGIVLYKMLNDGRLPFTPAAPKPLRPDDNERAMAERMQGKELPTPSVLAMFEKADMDMEGTDSDSLSRFVDIILRACCYQPENRYPSASAMAVELKRWMIRNEYKRESLVKNQVESSKLPDSIALKTGFSKQTSKDAGNDAENEEVEESNQDEKTTGYLHDTEDTTNEEFEKITDKLALTKEIQYESDESIESANSNNEIIDWSLLENIPLNEGTQEWLKNYGYKYSSYSSKDETVLLLKGIFKISLRNNQVLSDYMIYQTRAKTFYSIYKEMVIRFEYFGKDSNCNKVFTKNRKYFYIVRNADIYYIVVKNTPVDIHNINDAIIKTDKK
jgi:serine/threonine protein kinase